MGNWLCFSADKNHRQHKPKHRNLFQVEAVHIAGAPQLSVLRNIPSVERNSLITDKYTLAKELGRGEFGITYLCVDKSTKDVMACKSISKRKLRTAVDIEDVRREVTIMRHLPSHPNIISLKGVYEDDNTVHLLMEFCEGGELFDRIVSRGHYNEKAAASVARTIVEVVKVCHEYGVIHRDLKPENFLFAKKDENADLKVIDFGLSVKFKHGERFSEIVGSPYYMAPEVLKRNYGPEVDVWSAGVMIYILLCGVPPFWAETEPGIAHAILHGVVDFTREPWPSVSNSAKSLIRGMLERDPKRRLTPQQAIDHPWLQNNKHLSTVSLGGIVQSRLKQFSAMNKLKRAALRIIVELLSGEEVDKLKDMFDIMDTNKSGLLTFEQFKNGLRKFGSQLSEQEIRQLMDAMAEGYDALLKHYVYATWKQYLPDDVLLRCMETCPNSFRQADVDKKGTLDYGKFASLTLQYQMLDNDDYLHKAFSYFDKDRNGFIDMHELMQALSEESVPDASSLQAIMNDVDTDKDGQISYVEFKRMMEAGIDWRKVSRHYSRERFNSLSVSLLQNGSREMKESYRSR